MSAAAGPTGRSVSGSVPFRGPLASRCLALEPPAVGTSTETDAAPQGARGTALTALARLLARQAAREWLQQGPEEMERVS
jgi:hypothetical protein